MNEPLQIQNLEIEAVLTILQSRRDGLASSDAAKRLIELGPNSVETSDPWRILRSLLRQLTNFFTLLLLASAAICFVAENLQPGESMAILGWALAGVALLNAIFSFIQEYRAEKAMAALRQYLPAKVEILRDGQAQSLLATDLVPGDLILLSEGDRVPADARIIFAEGLLVNNAPLTGEAQPVSLQAAPFQGRLIESNNIAFAGCLVLRGTAQAVVFATGLRTEFGHLAHLSQGIRRAPSPLERQTAHMVRVLTMIAVSLGFSFFLYGIFSGRSLWVNLVFMMGIIVANVPEGLLPTFTLALAMGSLRMARKNVLVTSLNAVEGLGAVQVICTDKTGTLTLNQLAIKRITPPLDAKDSNDLKFRTHLLEQALGASDVKYSEKTLSGDPLDIAIAKGLLDEGEFTPESIKAERHFPFDVEKKRAAGIILVEGARLFVVKGAWEALRPLLGSATDSTGEVIPVNAEILDRAEATMAELAASGLRVVAVASRSLDDSSLDDIAQEELEQRLCLGGFIAIEDPIRQEVPAAINNCRHAGIDVILITGDHPNTAQSIALQCGIIEGKTPDREIMLGSKLENLTERALEEALNHGVHIFARTSPTQKMKIVDALKNLGKVVAMTGDGVNDAPALKAADIGIAMGKGGTDVARASAQIVLLDDNFASIVSGIEEGRTVFTNIRKFTNYVLVSNGPEILPYLLYILLPVPLALTVIQILAIDLGTDIIPSMALGQEPPEPETMDQPPREKTFHLLDRRLVLHSYLFLGLLEAIWSLGLFFYVLVDGGWRFGAELATNESLYKSATGIALATILLMQIGNLIGRRYQRRSGLDRGVFRNRLLLAGIAVQVIFSWGLLYLPPLQKVLGTGAVDWSVYLIAWLGIPLIFGADYLRKRLFLNEPKVSK